MVPVAEGARGYWGSKCSSQEEHQVRGRTSGVRAAPPPGPGDGMTLRKETDGSRDPFCPQGLLCAPMQPK